MYFDNHSEHVEMFLDPSIQLSQSQGVVLFAHIAKSEFARRPDGLRPTCARPLSIVDIKDGLQADDEAAAAAQSASVEAPVPKVAGLCLGSMEKPAPKAKKGPGKRNPNLLALTASPDDFEHEHQGGHSMRNMVEDAKSESRQSETSKHSKGQDEALDEEMQKVAQVHCAGPGTSAKCLKNLTAERFLLIPNDPAQAKKHNQSNSTTLSGVGCV